MSNKIVVAGLVNLETNLRIDEFPIQYSPSIFASFGVSSNVSGVGFNVAKALTTLGDEVDFLSFVGEDAIGHMVVNELEKFSISTSNILMRMEQTPQSVILFDKSGKRQANTDLKNMQDLNYPEKNYKEAIETCSLAALCNINFSRPMLMAAKNMHKTIATDVHVISNIEDEYNQDYMKYSDILFMSDEKLPCNPEEWAKKLQNRFGNEIIVIGLGSNGALLCVKKDNFVERIPAVYTRPVVNTIGAGDALFSSFIHFYNKNRDPYEAIKKAVYFASYKIGENGAAKGFLSEEKLAML